MASIEQDDLFNAEDDDMEDEYQDNENSQDYDMEPEDNQLENDNDQEDDDMIDGEDDEMEDDEEGEDEDGEEGDEEEDDEEGEVEEEGEEEEGEVDPGAGADAGANNAERGENAKVDIDEDKPLAEQTGEKTEVPTEEDKVEALETEDNNQSDAPPDTAQENTPSKPSQDTQIDSGTPHSLSTEPTREELINDIEESETNLPFREQIIAKARKATDFDIIPQVAIPYTSQCHALAFTQGPKWILTGGEDGFIRKYDFIQSVEGKAPLTMAQKHNLSDSLSNGGVICSYWENEQPLTRKQLMKQNPKLKDSDFSTGSVSYEPKVNPVYALEAERNGLWCLSGLLSGGISLYTMRYNEGTIHHYFNHGTSQYRRRGHTDAVSALRLNQEQDRFLSGSWDKTIREWDLNTGKTIIEFLPSSGQISNIQYRPDGLEDVKFTITDGSGDVTNRVDKDNANDDEDDVDSLFGDSDQEEKQQEDNKPTKDQETHPTPKEAQSKSHLNSNIFMSSSIDGTINIWDVRLNQPVIRLGVSEGTPPWCMSSTWSNDGDFIYAGRRNSTIEEISIKMPHTRSKSGHHKDTMVPNVSKLLQFPKISGPVSALSTMPNKDFLLCGSNDNIRLYNLRLYDDLNNVEVNLKKQATPFLIVPGHHGGMLSQLHVDETGRFMVSASGYRGWGHGQYTDTVLIYEIDFE
ncbi:Spt8 protein [Candida orthopsilosis Co 90-125]|uniref:Spt8 protein n=1 Tax=Candida orthopsilosis (strain 90-125) TaxID=1136231 RepID=H8X975_CANO9|nr:Spt8 protein [Candida orthopsilosis Co 90-125]CCG24374.1 Spt8 protein [Candida orthopsilosis Co 90-125]